jgi:hypothetical protein
VIARDLAIDGVSYRGFDFGLVALFLFPAWVLLLDMPAPL